MLTWKELLVNSVWYLSITPPHHTFLHLSFNVVAEWETAEGAPTWDALKVSALTRYLHSRSLCKGTEQSQGGVEQSGCNFPLLNPLLPSSIDSAWNDTKPCLIQMSHCCKAVNSVGYDLMRHTAVHGRTPEWRALLLRLDTWHSLSLISLPCWLTVQTLRLRDQIQDVLLNIHNLMGDVF